MNKFIYIVKSSEDNLFYDEVFGSKQRWAYYPISRGIDLYCCKCGRKCEQHYTCTYPGISANDYLISCLNCIKFISYFNINITNCIKGFKK